MNNFTTPITDDPLQPNSSNENLRLYIIIGLIPLAIVFGALCLTLTYCICRKQTPRTYTPPEITLTKYPEDSLPELPESPSIVPLSRFNLLESTPEASEPTSATETIETPKELSHKVTSV